MKKIFLICPVREITEEERKRIELYIEKEEKQGNEVYWPVRNTDQDDPIGLRICTDNAEGIIWSTEVHIWWNEKSQGSLFDFGMSFMQYITAGKKIVLANPEDVKPTERKSFNNVLLALHEKNIKGEEK